jgi:hypothetical protein
VVFPPSSCAAILDPELVVVGGDVGHNLAMLGDAMSRRIEELGPLRPTIVPSALSPAGHRFSSATNSSVLRYRLSTSGRRRGPRP